MDYREAANLALSLCEAMAPYCERVEIAGSIRRRKAECRDVEIVAVPKWEIAVDPSDLFGETYTRRNRLHEWATGCGHSVHWIKPGTSEVIAWHPQADGRYWRGLLPNGAKLDLFLAAPENWGLIYLIRTGPAEFSQAVVTHALRVGMKVAGGELHGRDGRVIPTPEEPGVFAALGLEYVVPQERRGPESLRMERKAVARC